MKSKDLSYSEAQTKIEEIVSKIENNEVDLEDLTIHLKEAKELIKYCEVKLRKMEDNIQ